MMLTFDTPDKEMILPDNESLIIHRHGDAETRAAVLFVHGWGGAAYSTWGDFPGLLYDDRTFPADISLFDYESGVRGAGRVLAAAPTMPMVSRALAGHIQAQFQNKPLYVICHSMGGLIFYEALRMLYEMDANLISPVAGIIMLASPANGVDVAKGLRRVIPDARGSLDLLAPGSDQIAQVSAFVADRLVRDMKGRVEGREAIRIPVYAAFGSEDSVVRDPVSARHGVPSRQFGVFPKTHKSICKPNGPNDDVYSWTVRSLLEMQAERAGVSVVPSVNSNVLNVHYRASPSRPAWELAFRRASLRFEESERVKVARSATQGALVSNHLLARVLTPTVASSPDRQQLLVEEWARQGADGGILGVAVVGNQDEATVAATTLDGLLAEPQGALVNHPEESVLEREMMDWMKIAADKLSPTGGFSKPAGGLAMPQLFETPVVTRGWS